MQENKYLLLSEINSPRDLKALEPDEVLALSDEIREFLIENVSACGGHLASNLGVVELTIALHRVFDTPDDKLVWDVGHQSYVHKLLTGRREAFESLRTPGGLSGFTKMDESEYDAFGAGHSSTSISAALGIAEAEHLRGGDSKTVAIVGDGAFTGGMIYEALNNCDRTEDIGLVIILNENEMSISKNIGSVAKTLAKLRSKRGYFKTKAATRGFISKIPLVGKPLVSLIVKAKKSIKNLLYGSNYFEDLGLHYLGPVDGHDIDALESTLSEARRIRQSVIVHVKTTKGKGYTPAEEKPDKYHSLPPKDAEPAGGFSREFGSHICTRAGADSRICAITAAMGRGTGLSEFEVTMPDRFFDVGIAEEHAVTFAAGLSAGQLKPVCAIYSTFLQRAYDSIVHDVALQRLPVIFAIDRAGLNVSDGATHHGIFDVAFLSSTPNVDICTPATYECLDRALDYALEADHPVAIRYPNAVEDELVAAAFYAAQAQSGLSIRTFGLGESTENIIIVHGRMATTALDALGLLEENGCTAAIILCEFIKPYDRLAQLIKESLPDSVRNIVFLEEEIRAGGFGMNLADEMSRLGALCGIEYRIVAVDDDFVVSRKGQTVYETAGVDAESVCRVLCEMNNL